ncbi:hypothetical protein TRAPUB_10324 [Trametes pubescens]|uniref:Uncharacterized protein n=1 Tax=Trametes pubescens TaxID=154538 RepID=A0A1M2W028_TRAPU|nr:hypothetical protein TRAPUB_10324 [Trametes pubescens]
MTHASSWRTPAQPHQLPVHPSLADLAQSPPSSPVQEYKFSDLMSAAGKGMAKVDKGKKRASEPDKLPPAAKKAKVPANTAPTSAAKGKGRQPAAKPPAVPQGGRQPGASNYTEEDLEALLDLVGTDLPIGQTMWQRITDDFNEWAGRNNRPARTQKPLKTKFEAVRYSLNLRHQHTLTALQLVRTTKPTGNATLPPHVARAWQIEDLINEKVHLRTLDDSEIADNIEPEVDADSDVEIIEAPSSSRKKTQPVMKAFQTPAGAAGSATPRTMSTPAPRRGAQAQEFMSAVTASLDPAYRESRDDARFARKFAQDELQRMTQENRDLRARNDTLTDRLHTQSLQVQQQLTEVTRLQARLDTIELMHSIVPAELLLRALGLAHMPPAAGPPLLLLVNTHCLPLLINAHHRQLLVNARCPPLLVNTCRPSLHSILLYINPPLLFCHSDKAGPSPVGPLCM